MNFGQRTEFAVELRCIAGNGWDYAEDCDDEDIEKAINIALGEDEK
jgi:hypothetical protein